jgi:predicted nucleic acid-binding protein
MIFIVDTNILFSACLTPEGRIFEILFAQSHNWQIASTHFAVEELQRHKEKLVRLSKRSVDEVDKLLETILKQVDFFSEDIIKQEFWTEAYRLTVGVDSDDINFVALTLQTSGVLWTGDKKLSTHLKTMGFDRVINTSELYEQLEIGDD